jgi:phospholipase/carboxylesterase
MSILRAAARLRFFPYCSFFDNNSSKTHFICIILSFNSQQKLTDTLFIMNALLPHITLEPDTPAEATVIWFHGLGADGNDFVPIVPQLALPRTLPVRFIFPHAPVIPVTINGGYPMPAWFDIAALTPELQIDEKGLAAAIKAAQDLIRAEIDKGIAPTRIILAGFSQGGAIALSAALAYPDTLAGVIALSTFIPVTQLEHLSNDTHSDLVLGRSLKAYRYPIYMAHGNLDDLVPLSLGEQTYHLLKKNHFDVSWNIYPMGHEVCKNEIDSISKWLQESLATIQAQ